MKWDEVRGLVANDFVGWLDRVHREAVVASMLSRRCNLSSVEVYEAWGMVVLYAWKNGRVADDFNDAEHVRPWCMSRTFKMLDFIAKNERQRRGLRNAKQRSSECLISELESEHFQRRITFAAVVKSPPTMTPGGEGWLDTLLDELTDLQRDAVEMLVLAGMGATSAAKYMPGVDPDDISTYERIAHSFDGARSSALKKCRRLIGTDPRLAVAS